MTLTKTIAAGVLVGAVCAIAFGAYLSLHRDSKFVARCENLALQMVKAPSTYARFAVREAFDGDRSVVIIDFDSQNGFGAILRSTATCRFESGDLAFAMVGDQAVNESLLDLF